MTSSSPNLLWLTIGAVVGLAGFALLAWALYGDRAKGRRRCPKCWYELGAGQGLRCPECGREAKSERQLGRPRRRRRLAVLGFVVVLAGTGVAVWPSARAYDWNRVKPVWWLVREGKLTTPGGVAAREELLRRVHGDRLSDARIDEILEYVRTLQRDPARAWRGYETFWADVVETAWESGRLDDDQVARYLQTAFDGTHEINLRPRVRAGGPLPLHIGQRGPYLGSRWGRARLEENDVIEHYGQFARVTIDGDDVSLEPWGRWIHIVGMAGLFGVRSERPVILERALEPGDHAVRVEWDSAVYRGPLKSFGHLASLDDVPSIVARWTHTFEMMVEVVDGPTVTLVADESLREEIEGGFGGLVTNTARVGGSNWGIRWSSPAPADLSFDVLGRSTNGREERLGTILIPRGQRGLVRGRGADHPRALFPEATTIDLILRASADAAERTVNVTEIWDGEIVIEDVPIR